jgi:hypothetical protein
VNILQGFNFMISEHLLKSSLQSVSPSWAISEAPLA